MNVRFSNFKYRKRCITENQDPCVIIAFCFNTKVTGEEWRAGKECFDESL